jgi:hypothetical protein
MITTAPNSTSVVDETHVDGHTEPTSQPESTATPASRPDEITQMIAQCAYYIAERRGFEPGHDVDDWLAAEAQVLDSLIEREI